MYNLTTIQIILKSSNGKVITVNKRLDEKGLKAYRGELRDICEAIGLQTADIVFGYNNAPENAQILPVLVPTEKKVEPIFVKDEKVDIHDLPQYRGKPKIKSKKS